MTITKTLAAKMQRAVSQANGRAGKLGNEGRLTYQQWARILDESQGQCHYCKEHFGVESLTLEHVVSLADGGSNLPDNIVAACGVCNQRSHWQDEPLQLKPIEKAEGFLTAGEAARHCACTTWLVAKWRKLGKLKPRGIWTQNSRHVLYHRDDLYALRAYVETCKM